MVEVLVKNLCEIIWLIIREMACYGLAGPTIITSRYIVCIVITRNCYKYDVMNKLLLDSVLRQHLQTIFHAISCFVNCVGFAKISWKFDDFSNFRSVVRWENHNAIERTCLVSIVTL